MARALNSLRECLGMTLVELLIGAVVLVVAILSLLGVSVGQAQLNEHARNLSWAISDAGRVVEEMRRINSGAGCTTPSAASPGGSVSWNAWLAGPGGGKSLELTGLPAESRESVAVSQTGGPDPLQMTVAICWRHRNRTFGECTWNGATLTPQQGANNFPNDTIFQSQAMIATEMTCRL